jgi:hypothetical protein
MVEQIAAGIAQPPGRVEKRRLSEQPISAIEKDYN